MQIEEAQTYSFLNSQPLIFRLWKFQHLPQAIQGHSAEEKFSDVFVSMALATMPCSIHSIITQKLCSNIYYSEIKHLCFVRA